jgi:cytochrome c oxidase subunit 2
VGPNLTNFHERTTLGAGMLDNTPENLTRWIDDPTGVKPGNKMPNLPLTPEQIEAVVAYLQEQAQ